MDEAMSVGLKDEIIAELVELVLMQEKEIKNLKEKVHQVKQYIEVYEEYIKGERGPWEL